MKPEVRQRLKWVKLYEVTGNAGLVCLKCGISRPTLRKWLRRYEQFGLSGLKNLSRRPKNSPNVKVGPHEESLILELRKQRNLGARRIKNELQRLHSISLSIATIHKTLTRNNVKPIVTIRKRNNFVRYQRPIPGERIQMDTCKIAPGIYQYTAVDDCTRYRVLRTYTRRTSSNTLDFLDTMIEEMPFPVQRIQTDRGGEFFAIEVQQRLKLYEIKFRPIKPGSPHLNGKVERSQKTDKIEFYATLDLSDKNLDLDLLLAEWQHYYNWQRPHSSLGGKSPMDRYLDLIHETPYLDEVLKKYNPAKERIQEQNYRLDLHLKKLKGF